MASETTAGTAAKAVAMQEPDDFQPSIAPKPELVQTYDAKGNLSTANIAVALDSDAAEDATWDIANMSYRTAFTQGGDYGDDDDDPIYGPDDEPSPGGYTTATYGNNGDTQTVTVIFHREGAVQTAELQMSPATGSEFMAGFHASSVMDELGHEGSIGFLLGKVARFTEDMAGWADAVRSQDAWNQGKTVESAIFAMAAVGKAGLTVTGLSKLRAFAVSESWTLSRPQLGEY